MVIVYWLLLALLDIYFCSNIYPESPIRRAKHVNFDSKQYRLLQANFLFPRCPEQSFRFDSS